MNRPKMPKLDSQRARAIVRKLAPYALVGIALGTVLNLTGYTPGAMDRAVERELARAEQAPTATVVVPPTPQIPQAPTPATEQAAPPAYDFGASAEQPVCRQRAEDTPLSRACLDAFSEAPTMHYDYQGGAWWITDDTSYPTGADLIEQARQSAG